MNNDIKQSETGFVVVKPTDADLAWASFEGAETWEDNLTDVLQHLHNQGVNLEPGMIVWCGEKKKPSPEQFMPDSDQILNLIQEAADESEGGEWCDDFIDSASVEAREELDTLLEAWARKHLYVHWWLIDKTMPYTITAEDIADVNR